MKDWERLQCEIPSQNMNEIHFGTTVSVLLAVRESETIFLVLYHQKTFL